MTTVALEKRLVIVEQALRKLEGKAEGERPNLPVGALDATHATFENDADFQEAMRLGRKWRAAKDGKSATRKNDLDDLLSRHRCLFIFPASRFA